MCRRLCEGERRREDAVAEAGQGCPALNLVRGGHLSTSADTFATATSSLLSSTYPMVLMGREGILSVQAQLVELAERTGQSGAADYVDYFLTQPYMGGKIPHLILLLRAPVHGLGELRASSVVGAVLLHEYRRAGIPLKIFVTEDYAGERNVLAAKGIRSAVAMHVGAQLLRDGAYLVITSLRDAEFELEGLSVSRTGRGKRVLWAVAERTLTRRLPLAESFDATLATLGSHTRRNLRYYRRRVEEQMGCRFVPDAAMTEEEFVALNGLCSYPTPLFVARWRYRTALTVRGGVLAGIRAGDGTWLSVVGGRRYAGTTSIDWQMNQTRFSGHSLSTVMRSYLIEEEIRAGSRTLLFEGGTPHPMQLSFAPDRVSDLVLVRDGVVGRAVRRCARSVLPATSFLPRVLSAPELVWRRGPLEDPE